MIKPNDREHKMIKPKCRMCNKEVGYNRVYYCSDKCMYSMQKTEPQKEQQRKDSKQYYYDHREEEDFRKKRTANMRRWYERNKEKQKKNILRNYQTNKVAWAMREFSRKNKKILIAQIPKCELCNKKTTIINIKKYDRALLPKLRNKNLLQRKELLIKYAKKNLRGICSKDCLGKIRWGEQ